MVISKQSLERLQNAATKLRATGSGRRWSPTEQDARIRLLPWPDGDLVKPIDFYFGIDDRGIVVPDDLKEDPIAQERVRRVDAGEPVHKEMRPSRRYHVPVVVRDGNAAVRVWAFGEKAFDAIRMHAADIFDPDSARDLIVRIVRDGRYPRPDIRLAKEWTRLHDDTRVQDRLLQGVPSLDRMYSRMPSITMEQRLKSYLRLVDAVEEFHNGVQQ